MSWFRSFARRPVRHVSLVILFLRWRWGQKLGAEQEHVTAAEIVVVRFFAKLHATN
jgi:hypothetical protein